MSDHLPLPELEKRLLQAIDQRYQAQAGRDLADYVFANHLFQTFPPAFLEFSYQHRHDIAAYLADKPHVARLTEYCIRATKTYTYRRNQFINFTDFYDDLLTAQYRHFLGQLQAALVQSETMDALAQAYTSVLQQHHARLRLIFSTYCVSYQPTGLAGHDLLKTVPCDEYSPLFQLSLLHIDAATLMEPILDIGCGASGALVDYLLAQGHTAFGLDRLAPTRPQFSQHDWFTFDYGQNQWGTIIAHQSFSTHFIYAHLHSDDQADQFARLYMKLLAGLKPGGALYYAPGLPFIEEHLTARPGFSLTKTIIETDTTLGIGELFYAVKIEKAA
ncbi:MAG: class I SAM-dependent methyltransferase [Anaerolineae bacterium]|nr:class I SAM-dependent methyltransferase [Anaerolineae bacterium]MCB9105764.1 class I SAM-dependent methyltransferase [Anaerolineales bacterium]